MALLESGIRRALWCHVIGPCAFLALAAGTKEALPQTDATENPKAPSCLEAQQDVSAFDLAHEEARRRHVWVAQDSRPSGPA
jgi:hypothetical protein